MFQMNLSTKQKERHRCREHTYGYQAGERDWDGLGDW